MIGRLRQHSEPRLGEQARIEKSQTPVERDIVVQWVSKICPGVVNHSDQYFQVV